jgi:hypothetical protein
VAVAARFTGELIGSTRTRCGAGASLIPANARGGERMKWAIEVDCQPSSDQLVLVQATLENASDFLRAALDDLEVPEPQVEARMVP